MGVRKAIDCVIDTAHGNKVTYTLGPLIHNPQALKMLESRNIYIADDVNETLKGKTVVTRAHGVTVQTLNRLKELSIKVVDATCPKVLRSENIIKKYYTDDYSIIIVGDRGHAEIEALLSITGGNGIVIESIDEALRLPRMKKVCVVAQTTFNIDKYREIADEICIHAEVCHVAETICAATENRQEGVRKLAEETDATVVVGGKTSANTRRLAEISLELGQPTFHIEDPSELDLKELSQYDEIGVTAGASTPNWVIKQVIDSIAGYTPGVHRSISGLFMSLAFYAIEGNFVLCAGAAALTYAMCLFMSIPPYAKFFLMPFFYLLPLHEVNKYLEINWKQISMKQHKLRLRRYWRFFLIIGSLSFVISLVIAWYEGALIFVLVTISYLLGGLYSVRIVPGTWNTRYKSFRDIPGSKDVMIATAWTFAVVILPSISYNIFPGFSVIVSASLVFILVFSRATILAIAGVQSDKIVGLETIPVLIGSKKTQKLLYAANITVACSFFILVLSRLLSVKALILIIPVIYMVACLKFLNRRGQFFTLYHQMTLDADFFLTGLLAILFLR